MPQALKYWQQLIFLSFCILLFGLAAILLGQDANWDLRSYHFYNGYAFLNQRIGWDVAPAGEQSFLNPFFDVFNYLLIKSQAPLLASFILGAISGLNCFLLFKIALLCFNTLSRSQALASAFFSMLLGVTGAAGLGLIGTTTNDTKMAFFILLALYCLMKGLQEKARSWQIYYVLVAGLIMGFDVGLKLVAACYGLALLIALLLLKPWGKKTLAEVTVFLLAMFLGFLLSNGYWMYFLYSHFHNPIFPYYNNIFNSPYAPALSFADPKYYPQHYLTLPFLLAKYNNLISDAPIAEPRFALLYVLALIFIVRKFIFQRTPMPSSKLQTNFRLLLIFFVASYLLWFFEFTIYRYLLPLELLSGLLIVYFVRSLFKAEVFCQLSLSLCLVLLVFTTHPFNWGRVALSEQYFEITAPALPANSTVLLTATPLAYTIPYFQKDLHFVSLPFFIKQAKLSGVKNPLTMPLNSKLQTEAVNPLIRAAKEGKLYALSFHSHSTDLSKLAFPFQSNYLVSRETVQEPWRLYRLVTQEKNIVLEAYDLDEIPRLNSFLNRLPPQTLAANLTKEEQQVIEKIMRRYQEMTPFQKDADAGTRSLLYQYGLLRDEKHCILIYTKIDNSLELCPLKKASLAFGI